jgi:hypothetical protein
MLLYVYCLRCIGLLTLTAIDGLGGVKSSMSDDVQSLHEKTGCGILYFIFAILNVCAILFIHYYVPETKGKTPEQITGGPTGAITTSSDDHFLDATGADGTTKRKWNMSTNGNGNNITIDSTLNAPLLISNYSLNSGVSHSL